MKVGDAASGEEGPPDSFSLVSPSQEMRKKSG